MRRGDEALPRLFLVSSAGGTVGAYERVAAALTAPNAVVGVRDPFLWGQRDPLEGFDAWMDGYLDAILSEQERGPYCLCAYSSAGAFGLELARRLEARGATVGLLALIDPLALACRTNRYGHWAFRSTWAPRRIRALVRAAGWGRLLLGRRESDEGWLERLDEPEEDADDRYAIAEEATRTAGHLTSLAALLELNTGVPVRLSEADFEGVEPDRALPVFQERVVAALPDVDPPMLRRLAIQYSLQVRTQHDYHLAPIEAPVLLVEPRTRYAGVLRLLLGPYVPRIESHRVALGPPSEDVQRLVQRFSPLHDHYRSMRDDMFVAGLADLLSDRLRRVASPR
jgi:thioesterase domain-containing protein